MNDEVIAHMEDRIRRIRRIAEISHDPGMIEMLLKLAEEGEADIEKLKAERKAAPRHEEE